MIIERKVEKVNFYTLGKGKVFEFIEEDGSCSEIYLKIEESWESNVNAVNLGTGDTAYFKKDDKVVPKPKAKLILE